MLLGMCGQVQGNFCDIAKPDVYVTTEVATYMVTNDPEHVRQDLSENAYGEKHCVNWGVLPAEGS